MVERCVQRHPMRSPGLTTTATATTRTTCGWVDGPSGFVDREWIRGGKSAVLISVGMRPNLGTSCEFAGDVPDES